MGTSSSSLGPSSGVPLIPPWADNPPTTLEEEQENEESTDDTDSSTIDDTDPTATPQLLAGPARFGSTRTSLNRFGKNGARHDLRAALGNYVRRGYGGSATAAQRMARTVQTAGRLYSVLAPAIEGEPSVPSDLLSDLLNSETSAEEIIAVIVEAVSPIDGTLDSENARRAIKDALSDLLEQFPEADLLALSAEQGLLVVERFISLDIYGRIALDVGKTIQDAAPSARDALSRLKDIRDYIVEVVSAQFRSLGNFGQQLSYSSLVDLSRQVLQQTLQVFEEYVL